jgi:hypothetical protein
MLIAEETEKWAKVVKFSGAKPDTLQFETPAERFNACVASTG